LAEDLAIIEEYLGELFMPEFARAVVDKQLSNIGESRETYNRSKLDMLLREIERRVLVSFKGDEAHTIVQHLKRSIIEREVGKRE